MWFDRTDARDPLQLTDGVYGLLLKYTFINNVNLWFWTLYGNDGLKGWEFLPSMKRDPEYGGRVQVPVPQGEIAVSLHHRKTNLDQPLFGMVRLGSGAEPEDRLGLDGKWDLGIGVWCEAAWVHQDLGILGSLRQRFYNVGADYTVGIGSGLHILAEYFNTVVRVDPLNFEEQLSFSAASANYPIGLLDSVTGMLYRAWKNHAWYRFVDWQRKTDNWSFHLIGFWNPDQFQLVPSLNTQNPLAGKGIELMVVFNH
jgi:hypothetical protein